MSLYLLGLVVYPFGLSVMCECVRLGSCSTPCLVLFVGDITLRCYPGPPSAFLVGIDRQRLHFFLVNSGASASSNVLDVFYIVVDVFRLMINVHFQRIVCWGDLPPRDTMLLSMHSNLSFISVPNDSNALSSKFLTFPLNLLSSFGVMYFSSSFAVGYVCSFVRICSSGAVSFARICMISFDVLCTFTDILSCFLSIWMTLGAIDWCPVLSSISSPIQTILLVKTMN